MLNELLDRAAVIWDNEEFDEDEEAFDVEAAWGQAVEELIKTDVDALVFVTETLSNEQLTTIVKWGNDLGGEEQSFADLIRGSLYGREPFITFAKDRIPNYDQKMGDRKARADAYHAAKA